MNLKTIFRGISTKLLVDFQISSQVNHQGVKGTYREDSLKNFLITGRLPDKYGLGSGEIVSPTMDVSKQCDLIIYDKFNSIPLLYNEQVQIYPIDCVYGVIEVKSGLSKQVLIEALENIRSVKSLAPQDTMEVKLGPLFTQGTMRPIPFGIIFAYSLAGNSLNSLTDNIREWERSVDPNCWPNMVVVLEEGMIYHYTGTKRCFASNVITNHSIPIGIHHQKDTLFHFYCTLLDLCRNTFLSPISLNKYFDPSTKMGIYIVKNHDKITKRKHDGTCFEKRTYRLKLDFIHRIVTYSRAIGKLKYRDILLKQFGMIPEGISNLDFECYLYDPENLPGIHEVKLPIEINEFGHPVINARCQVPPHYIEVDGDVYYFPFCYINSEEDLEEDPLNAFDDL